MSTKSKEAALTGQGQEPPKETEAGNVGDIAATLLNAAPGVSEHVVQREQTEIEEKENAPVTDKFGTVFDSAVHCADENSQPVLTTTGAYRRKAGRKATGDNISRPAVKSQLGTAPNASNEGPVAVSQVPGAIAAGKVSAAMLVQLGMMIGGDEWHPVVLKDQGINEMESLEIAFGNYYQSKGMADFPPGVALCLAIGCYAAPRFVQPKTKTRLERLKTWIAGKFDKKKAPEKIEEKPASEKA